MSKLPQVRRLLIEDFLDQKDWIGNLFSPLNVFMDGVTTALSKGVSLRDNMAADIIVSLTDRVPTLAEPILLPWNSKLGAPLSVTIGNIQKAAGDNFTLASVVGIQWNYTASKGIMITNIIGLTPTSTDKYNITYTVFAG
jgi:hypothetical protein